MKIKDFLLWLLCLCLILGCLPAALAAEQPPSQAGERRLYGAQRDFSWPVPGAYNLSSCFLDNRAHYSLDIAAPHGTDVIASYAGEVIKIFTDCEHNWGKSGSCCSSWGNYVLMEHLYQLENGESVTLYSRYAHLGKVSVSVGQDIEKGQKIGTVGSTGRSSGPHLDYEILYGGTSPSSKYSLDPYINELLELPEELHTTFGSCCKEYVAYVKTYYPRCLHKTFDHMGKCADCGYEYNWKSTWDSDSMGYYAANTDAQAFSVPYTQEDSGIPVGKDTVLSVRATVINGLGQAFLEVTLESGETGYIHTDCLTFQGYFESEITGKLSTLEDGQTLKQESHRVDGRITSLYPLRKICAYLDGALYATWTGRGGTRQVDLRGTAVNKKLSFAELSPGEHTLIVTAEDSTGREAMEVVHCTFYIEETPRPTEPPETEPPETQPEATQPPETEPEITQPPETRPAVTEPTFLPSTEPATTTTIPPATEPELPQNMPSEPNYLWIVGVIFGVALIAGLGIILLRKHKEKGNYEQ